MNFEFVEFYACRDCKRKKNWLGTVHIYVVDDELEIRGIRVTKHGKTMFFHLPHFMAIDVETKTPVRYPFIRWRNLVKQKALMDFLHQHVKPIIRERLKNGRG